MKVPAHLGHLPTFNGMPVPYINVWGDEADETKWSIRHDPVVGQNAMFTGGDRLAGTPDFTRQSIQRQRQVMAGCLCQVCGRPVGADRFLLLSSMSTQRVVVAGRPEVAVTEPWLCLDCLGFSVRHCPGIRRRASRGGVSVARVAGYELIASTMTHDHLPGQVAIGWLKVLIRRGELVDLDEIG